MTKQKKPTHYVNNKAFHDALVERKVLIDTKLVESGIVTKDELDQLDHEARKALIKRYTIEHKLPQISNFIGDCFLKMATNITYKYNFNRYPYKDEMICDGIIDCIKYVNTFDVTKQNPFAYFTSAISNAFIRRIIREKKEGYVKSKMLASSDILIHELQEQDEDGEFINAFRDYMSAYNNFDGSMFDKKIKEKTKTYNNATLDEFYEY